MKSESPIVAMLTDFGSADFYAAAMKGVILKDLPNARIIDVSHDVPPQDVRWGAFQLFAVFRSFPPGTLFLCVVDPGVGTERKIIYAEAGGYKFVAPDNGLLSWVFEVKKPTTVWALQKPIYAGHTSKTFHGRDLMAPWAAQILKRRSKAVPMAARCHTWVRIPLPGVRKTGSKWEGEVLGVDRFGNIVTSFPSKAVVSFAVGSKLWFDLGCGRRAVRGLSDSYASVPKGRLMAIEGSSGFIEISARQASAAQLCRLAPGDKINLFFRT